MKIHQIRNATIIVELGDRSILVDPMLGDAGLYPGFKIVGGGRQNNPLVPLPPECEGLLEGVTDVLLTHEHHVDHLDPAGLAWIKERTLPVWASAADVPNLKRRGVTQAQEVVNGSMELNVETVPAKHARGILGWLLGPGAGFYLEHPDEPSLYITGDTVMTADIREAIERLKPDVVVAPAGAANMGIGPNLLFSQRELLELAKLAPGEVVYNHLEALDHCPTTRKGLAELLRSHTLSQKTHIPADGETLNFEQSRSGVRRTPVALRTTRTLGPGFHKWLGRKVGGA